MSINLTVNGTTFSYPEQGDTNWGADATDWAAAVTAGMLQKAGGTFQLLSEVDFGTGFGIKSLYYKSRTANVASAGQIRLARADTIVFRNQANDGDLALSVDASNNLLFNGVSLAGVATVSDTDSIELVLTGVDLEANVKLSASAAGAGFLKNTLTIESDGLLVKTPIADTSTTGVLSDTDWDTFNNKQPAGDYITSLTGHVVAAGPGAAAATIQNDVITNAMINSAAAIAFSKLATLTAGNILVGSAGNVATSVAMSGDILISNTGVTSINSGVIVDADINAAAAIDYTKLNLTGGIIASDVAAGAAIEYTKLEVLTAQKVLVSSGAGYVSASSVTATELGYLASVTSAIQTQLDAKVAKSAYTGKGVILSASAASTPAALAAGTNGQVLIADNTTTEGVRWGAAASGGINYITNTNFAADTSGWATYADAAGTQPVNGTGGAANITFTRDTNSLVIGTYSGLITKDAVNRQGQGVSYDFSIDTALKNCPVAISNYLAASANFVFGSLDGVTPSDVTVWIYDVTNSVLITPFPNTIVSNIGQFSAQFQATSSTSYRLIYHIGTTNASAWTLALGNVSVGPQESSFIPSDSDWQSYTPSASVNQGLGTLASVALQYRKQGPDLLIKGQFTTGTVGGSEARLALPDGLVIASNVGTNHTMGPWFRGATATTHGGPILATGGAAYIKFSDIGVFGNSSVNPLTAVNGNVMAGTGEIISVSMLRIPIQGWTSGFTTADTVLTNVPVIFSAYKNGGSAFSSDTAIPSWTGVHKDSVGAFNSTTGIYTVKIPGDYQVNWYFRSTSAAAGSAAILVNGASVRYGISNTSNDSKLVTAVIQNLKVGDTVSVSASNGFTLSSSDLLNVWSMFKIETPAASLNIRKIATLRDEKAATTVGGGFTSGSYVTRTLNTEVDPYGIVSLSANQFILQPGTYRINASAPAFFVFRNKIKLRNITAGSDTIIGQNASSDSGEVNYYAPLSGIFSITVATTFEIQHRCQTTKATDGLGVAMSFGDVEVYTQVEIEKLL